MKYAGDGLWSCEQVAYNPMNFVPTIREYMKRCTTLGTVCYDALRFAATMKWEPA